MSKIPRRWEFNQRIVKLRHNLVGRIKENIPAQRLAYMFIAVLTGLLLCGLLYLEIYLVRGGVASNTYLELVCYFMFRNCNYETNIVLIVISTFLLLYTTYKMWKFDWRMVDGVHRNTCNTLAREEYGQFIIEEVLQVFYDERKYVHGNHLQIQAHPINTIEREILLCAVNLSNTSNMKNAVQAIIDKDLRSRHTVIFFPQYSIRIPYVTVLAFGITVFLLTAGIFAPWVVVLFGYYLLWTHGVTETQARMQAICDLLLAWLAEDAPASEQIALAGQPLT